MNPESKSSRLQNFIDNPRKALWTLSVPMMFGMMVQTVYMIVDMIFVGKINAASLTALAFNMPLVFLGLGLIFGLGSGVTAVIAQFIGAGDKRSADNSAEHAVVLGVVCAIFITFVGLRWGEQMLVLLGVPETILPLAWNYFKVMASGYIFVVLSIFFRSILSGEGDMKTPMVIQGSGTILNIILDPIFIFVFHMGVKGAAIATIMSQAVVCLIYIYLLFVKEHAYIRFAMKDFHFSQTILAKIFKIGLPASFSMIIMSMGGGAFNRILVSFSSDAVAAYQAAARIDHIFLMPVISITTGLVTLVGMFYGAKRMNLLRKIIFYGMSRSALIGIFLGTLFFIFARPLMGMFTEDTSIINLGAQYLRYIVFAYPFIAIGMTSGRVLQGLGFGMPLLILTFLRVLAISVSLAYLFVFIMGKSIEWVWIAMIISVILSSGVSVIWLRFKLGIIERKVEVKQPEAIVPEMISSIPFGE